MKKVLLSLFCMFAGIITVMADTTDSVMPNSIEMVTLGSQHLEYISGVATTRKAAIVDGEQIYVFCLEPTKPNPTGGTTLYKFEELNKYPALAYIINNVYTGYTGSDAEDKNYYVTQTAIWWYMDRIDGVADSAKGNLSATFKQATNDEYVSRAKALMEAALNYENNGNYDNPQVNVLDNISLKLSSDKNYYESDYISVEASQTINATFNVSFSGAPSGTIVVDESGNAKSTFLKNEEFKLKVPVTSLGNTINTNFNVTVNAKGVVNRAYSYESSINSEDQKVMPARSRNLSSNVNSSIKVNITRTSLSITKRDITNSEEIKGATLELYNSNSQLIERWNSNGSAHVINDLEPGNYYLVEVLAPDGYVLSVEKIEFTLLADGSVKNVSMTNAKTITKISKQDITTGKEVAGAHLVLKDDKSNIVEEWDSTEEAHYIYGLISGKKYTLEETIAPEGYILSKETVTFTIKEDGSITEVVMNNDPIVEVPKTASNIPSYVYMAGAILILSGLKLVFKRIKKS